MTEKTKVHHDNVYLRIKGGCSAGATEINTYPEDLLLLLDQWEDDTEFYMTITNSLSDIETIKVTDIDVDENILTVERGQDGTDAQQWYSDAIMCSRLVADNLDSFIQKEGFRTVSFNPNGVLTPNYRGEKVFQSLQNIWWKNVSGNIWVVIAGKLISMFTHLDNDIQANSITRHRPYYDGTFLYVPFINTVPGQSGGIYIYTVNELTGELTLVNTYEIGADYAVYGIWGDGTFLYFGGYEGFSQTFNSASVDGSGNITVLDSNTDFSDAPVSIWGDGTFIYTASYYRGVRCWSVDGSGNLTLNDTKDPGGEGFGVWGDGNFIYYAAGTAGLYVYSVDGLGNLTQVGHDDQGGTATRVEGDGTWIFLANGSRGTEVYSVDGSGALTHEDNENTSGSNDVACLDGYIYTSMAGLGLFVYTVNEVGTLNLEDSDDQGGQYYAVGTFDPFIFTCNFNAGISNYWWT